MSVLSDQRAAALATLTLYAQADTPPVVTSGELGTILDSNQRASFWLISTAHVYGDVIMPNVANGHRYRCVQGGTSGATEPVWPLFRTALLSDGVSDLDRKSTRLNSSHIQKSRMPSSA